MPVQRMRIHGLSEFLCHCVLSPLCSLVRFIFLPQIKERSSEISQPNIKKSPFQELTRSAKGYRFLIGSSKSRYFSSRLTWPSELLLPMVSLSNIWNSTALPKKKQKNVNTLNSWLDFLCGSLSTRQSARGPQADLYIWKVSHEQSSSVFQVLFS